jgi:cell division protein FtsB
MRCLVPIISYESPAERHERRMRRRRLILLCLFFFALGINFGAWGCALLIW